jgi:hypothetical protein
MNKRRRSCKFLRNSNNERKIKEQRRKKLHSNPLLGTIARKNSKNKNISNQHWFKQVASLYQLYLPFKVSKWPKQPHKKSLF